jgi:predicted small lipoprotein YifL
MRIVLAMTTLIALAACGQTGSLYLPDQGVETPVEIRTPATSAPAPVPAEEDKEKKNTQPPGG